MGVIYTDKFIEDAIGLLRACEIAPGAVIEVSVLLAARWRIPAIANRDALRKLFMRRGLPMPSTYLGTGELPPQGGAHSTDPEELADDLIEEEPKTQPSTRNEIPPPAQPVTVWGPVAEGPSVTNGQAPKPDRPPRGPSTNPAIPQGHELAGKSTLTGPDGELKAAWDKTRIHGADEAPNDPVPEGHLIKKTSTMMRGDGTTAVQWISSAADEKRREDAMRAAWARHASLYAGLADPVPAPDECDEDLITLYPLGDPHIGMLAWEPESGDNFNTKIACRELLACVRMLVAGAGRSRSAIVTNLGDFMHAQDDTAKTPGHGNQLDVDGRFAKVLDAGHTLLRGIVDATLERHEHVTVRNLPGNHDPRVAAELSMWLRAVYEREPRVTVKDAYAAHQYDRFGKCLFGWHHGDRCKAAALPALMATDRATDWGEVGNDGTRVWHVGHVHHLTRIETPGCIVETHRTMAAKDAWHAGRYRAGRSLSAITYHAVHGETDRKTVSLSRVRAAV